MINSIIAGISIALDAEFGYENHMEEIQQDLTEPCFFISCINPATKLYRGNKYFRQNQFCIQYFPESAKKQEECSNVGETLMEILEYITADGDLIRGSDMRFEIVDGILNFFVNYDCFVYKDLPLDDSMENMKNHIRVKDGDEIGGKENNSKENNRGTG